ncbi:MAG: efflux RND transporter permease subunit, partial [Flavitalea sp.]
VYLPILSLVGIEGKMFKPMAQTVSFALIGAFILSLTYIPMITSLVLSKKIREHHTLSDRMMESLQRFYKPVLIKAMQFPKTVVMIAVVLFLAALLILTRMGGEFIPELEEGDFAVDTRVLTGSSLSTTVAMTQKTAGVLKSKFPEVEEIVTKIGSGEIPTDPMPVEAADMMVILKDKSEWTSAKSFDELADKMSDALQVIPGVSVGFQFPVQMRFNELMTGSRQDVVCKIFGENLDSLAQYSKSLGEIVHTVEGATDLYLETVTGLPQIVIKFNRDALAMYKLNIEDVNRVIRTAFAGESAGKIYENERRFDLVVRLKNSNRKDVTDVQQLLIPTPGGTQVPLYHIADVSIKEGPNQIQREDAKRRIVVGFNVRGRDVQSIVEELQKKVTSKIKMEPGYYITYGGQFENLVEAKNRLSVAVPIALLLIFMMLYFAFGSVKHGLLIFSAIPLSAIGGVFALWSRGMPFSISAGIGFIALFGVAVLNGIVLITEFNRLKKEGLLTMQEIIVQGTAIRLRPVLMTAAVASLGFLPMALSKGAGAEVQRPLATVVIGGLLTATVLTLLVLPVLYAWFNKVRMKTKVVTVILLFVGLSNAQAQTKIGNIELTLSQMIDTGRSNNLLLKSGLKQVDYWQQMRRSAFDPGKANFSGEYGNVNSFNTDTRFNLTQDFQLPNVYRRQAKWYDANRITAESRHRVLEKDLTRDISLSYIELIDLLERKKMLASIDSVYASVSEKARA